MNGPIGRVNTKQEVEVLNVEKWWERGSLVVTTEGRVNGLNAAEYRRRLDDALEEESPAVVLNFEGLSYISSAGLRVVLQVAKGLRRRGAKFAACNLDGPVLDVFVTVGFDRIIPLHNSVDSAVASFLE